MADPFRIRPATAADAAGLAEVLLDCVAGGASVGFMDAITRAEAVGFWEKALASAARGGRVVLVAEDDRGVVGTVSVVPATAPNQPHRADIAKLQVHGRGRRRGLGAALVRAAEATARDMGRTLLVLDTVTDSDADRLYERLGWQRCGVIPRYALWPDGRPCAATVFFKDLVALDGVKDGYDRWAAVYDHDANPLVGLEGPAVRAAAGVPRGLAALDLGCGTGRHALWLTGQGANVTAVDFSAGMLDAARQKPGADAVRWVTHDLHRPLPFAAEFDLVVSGLVLEHLRELLPFFAEARRVLRPGGRAVVSAMHPAQFLRGTQARFTDPDSGELVQPGSVSHPVGTMALAAVRAGFTLADVQELAPDAAFAERFPRAAKYVGWPMLVVLTLAT